MIFASKALLLKSKKLILIGVFLCVLFLLSGCKGSIEFAQSAWSPSVKNCWPCILYKAVFDQVGVLTVATYHASCRAALMLMAAGWLFWISFKTIKMFASMQEPNLKQFWADILATLFKMLVVGSIILFPDKVIVVLGLIMTPIMSAFVELSRLVLYADPNIQEIFQQPGNYVSMGGESVAEYPLFSAELASKIQDLIYRVYIMLRTGMYLGFFLWEELTIISFLLGGYIIISFFFLMIVFPFSMVEIFIKLGVVIVLFPFILVAWVFPETKQVVGKAWQIFIGSMINLLLVCTFVGFMMIVLATFVDTLWPGFFSAGRVTQDAQLRQDFIQLSVGAFSFLFVIIFLMKFTEKINQFARSVGGEYAQSEFVRIFTALVKTVKGLTLAGLALAANAIPGVGTVAGKMMADKAKDNLKSAKDDMLKSETSAESQKQQEQAEQLQSVGKGQG